MEFADRLFNLIHGLPVEEPKYSLGSGPSEPGAFQKFHEKLVFDHMMGKTSAPAVEEIPVLEKLLQPRDSRDETSALAKLLFAPRDVRDNRDRNESLAKLFNIPGQPITPQPGGDLYKRFNPHPNAHEGEEEVVEEYSHGRVVAKLRNGVVVSTRYVAKES